MIKINTQSTEIPVEIGELKFGIDSSDEGLKVLLKKYSEVVKKSGKLKDADEKAGKQIVADCFDILLGKGAFDQIYAQTSSLLRCMQILEQLAQGIAKELAVLNPTNQQLLKAQEYIAKKK